MVDQRSNPRTQLLSDNRDKAWIYRVVAIQALAGIGLVEALRSVAGSIEQERADAGSGAEAYEARMGRTVAQVIEAFAGGATTLREGFEKGGVVLGMRERPFLEIPVAGLDDQARGRMFLALADVMER